LILNPTTHESHDFQGRYEAVIREESCTACGACLNLCCFDAIKETRDGSGNVLFKVDPTLCEGCGVCVRFCPKSAVDFLPRHCGVWMVAETRAGPMVHARLAIAAENSGKLVATVRQEARRVAAEKRLDLILVDGPPGIGCPVIASLSGASEALIVTEPTMSGVHDLERVLSLTKHFGIPAAICVNKWDINSAMTEKIERLALSHGAKTAGRIRYDEAATKAQMQASAIVETDAPCADDIRKIWDFLA
jgi:MinD superfamily P-loop ATPase